MAFVNCIAAIVHNTINHPQRVVRVAAGLSLMIVLGWAVVFAMPLPTSISVPAIVTVKPQCLVRSGVDGVDGFVTDVFVAADDRGVKGQPLLQLSNDQLEMRIGDLDLRNRQTRIHQRQAMDQDDAATEAVQSRKAASLIESRAKLISQAESLVVVAPHDGIVQAREFGQFVGTHVRQGRAAR